MDTVTIIGIVFAALVTGLAGFVLHAYRRTVEDHAKIKVLESRVDNVERGFNKIDFGEVIRDIAALKADVNNMSSDIKDIKEEIRNGLKRR